MAASDELGMNITLANGNVASRVLPVKIHDLDNEDQRILAEELRGPMRSIDFIYKEPGVNRPLKPSDDRNLNNEKTDYHNQINKVANALKEIGNAMLQPVSTEKDSVGKSPTAKVANPSISGTKFTVKSIFIGMLVVLAAAISYLLYLNIDSNSASTSLPELNTIQSIAILPFSNTKPDPDSDYLGFAIANQIIGQLDYNKNLTVRPSSAIRKYNQITFDTREVADDLKVNYILTGNYLKVNNVIRLDIELVDATNNSGIWRDELEVDFINAFELQDMVAQKVSDRLKTEFSAEELNTISIDVPSNPFAYDYYLRSLSFPLSVEGCLAAIDVLQKSLALDSTYAPAYVEIGARIQRVLLYGSKSQRQPHRPTFYYQKALDLNGNQIDALINSSSRYAETGRINEAVVTIRKALQLNPNNAHAHFYLGYIYRYAGFIEESIKEMELALKLYPANPDFRSLGISCMLGGYDNKALEALALDNGSIWELGWQLPIFYDREDFDKAISISNNIIERDSAGVWSLIAQVYLSAIDGNTKDVTAQLRKLEELNLDSEGNIIDGEYSFFNALYYSVLGDDEGVLRCLRKAVDNGYFNYPFLKNNPRYKHLHTNDTYKVILSIAKTKHEAFKQKFF